MRASCRQTHRWTEACRGKRVCAHGAAQYSFIVKCIFELKFPYYHVEVMFHASGEMSCRYVVNYASSCPEIKTAERSGWRQYCKGLNPGYRSLRRVCTHNFKKKESTHSTSLVSVCATICGKDVAKYFICASVFCQLAALQHETCHRSCIYVK